MSNLSDYITQVVLPRNWRLRTYLIALKRARIVQKNNKRIPPYLKDNDFLIELNFKFWVTKGARFKASERCEELDRRSARLVGWLSAYMIMFSVLPLCDLEKYTLDTNESTFIAISLSIMILVFSQLEYAKNYTSKAKEYHDCALDISKLYDELRYLKSTIPEVQKTDLFEKARKLSVRYEEILQRCDNHIPIDYDMFRKQKPEYFNLSSIDILIIQLRYFLNVRLIGILCIYGVPLVCFLAVYILKQ
jgi:hypothetical protein